MMTNSFLKIFNDLGWNVLHVDKDTYDVSRPLSFGQDLDFSLCLTGQDSRGLTEDFKRYYHNFNPDEFALIYYGKEKTPNLRLLLDEADKMDEELLKLKDALELYKKTNIIKAVEKLPGTNKIERLVSIIEILVGISVIKDSDVEEEICNQLIDEGFRFNIREVSKEEYYLANVFDLILNEKHDYNEYFFLCMDYDELTKLGSKAYDILYDILDILFLNSEEMMTEIDRIIRYDF